MAKIFIYNENNNTLISQTLSESSPLPYSYERTITVGEFRGSSNSPTLWTTVRAMEAWNLTRKRYGKGIYLGYAFKRIWEGGHSATSQHYAGVAFDVGQNLTSAGRREIWNVANSLGVWGYVEPISMTPGWIHFDRRFGKPACGGTSGYTTQRQGSRGVYTLIMQDALNALGFTTRSLDGIFGNNTYTALVKYQQSRGLTADGICGCSTWRSLTSRAVGIGRTSTVLD